MMACSSCMAKQEVMRKLRKTREASYFSGADQCGVVLVKCEGCEREFEEELEEARMTIIARGDHLCLACDPGAAVPSVSAVIVRIGRDQ